MIDIKIDRKDDKYIVSIQGHAGYVDYGNDIVCASISILYYTLAHSIIDLYDKDRIKNYSIKTEAGNSSIEFEAINSDIKELNTVLQTIATGFMLMQENYKDNVRLAVAKSLFL